MFNNTHFLFIIQLSLRDNPLVMSFVRDISLQPPTLLELAARVIKLYNIEIQHGDIPASLFQYLSQAHCCVNPKCKGKEITYICGKMAKSVFEQILQRSSFEVLQLEKKSEKIRVNKKRLSFSRESLYAFFSNERRQISPHIQENL